jgi:FAD/FMN-containing dehydrogenase
MCTVTVLPGDVWRFTELLTSSDTPDVGTAMESVDTRFVVEPLVARVHIALDSDDLEAAVAMITRLRARAVGVRGHLMIRRAAPELKERAAVWGDLEPPVVRLMERLKQTFDPDRRLSPGRFVASL